MTTDEIDRLYQLPLGEFTAARDALAKASGERRAEIKALEKPNAAAWGVNQLYWKRRRTLDRLLTAFDRLRKAQAARLAGKGGAIGDAELAHRSALQAAVDEVRELLTSAGDAASPATMTAVEETLQALPFSTPDGRLTRALRPVGFGALAGLMGTSAGGAARKADVLAFERPRAKTGNPARDDAKQARAEAKKRAEQEARLEKELRAARAKEQTAEARAAAAAEAAAGAARERDRLRDALEAADEDVVVKRRERESAAGEARAAAAARQAIEDELDRLRARG